MKRMNLNVIKGKKLLNVKYTSTASQYIEFQFEKGHVLTIHVNDIFDAEGNHVDTSKLRG